MDRAPRRRSSAPPSPGSRSRSRDVGPRPRSPAPARGDPARPRRRHDRRRAPHHAAVLGQRPVDRRLARHRCRSCSPSYAIFAQGIFFAPEIAGRAFRTRGPRRAWGSPCMSARSSASTASSGEALAIELPIVIGLALVATVAVFEPVAARVRRWLGAGEDDPSYDRMLRALGEDVLDEPGAPRTRSSRLSGGWRDGWASTGARSRMPSGAAHRVDRVGRRGGARAAAASATGRPYGSVAFGAKESGLPFTSRERDVLEMATGYLAASLELGARQAEQARDLERLSRERAAVSTSGRRLSRRPGASTGRGSVRVRAARVRPRPATRGTRRRAHPPVGRREGRHSPGGGALRLPLRPRRARRHEGRGDRADLAGRRPGPRRPRVPSHARRAAPHPRARAAASAQGSKAIGFSNDRYRLDPRRRRLERRRHLRAAPDRCLAPRPIRPLPSRR